MWQAIRPARQKFWALAAPLCTTFYPGQKPDPPLHELSDVQVLDERPKFGHALVDPNQPTHPELIPSPRYSLLSYSNSMTCVYLKSHNPNLSLVWNCPCNYHTQVPLTIKSFKTLTAAPPPASSRLP